LIIDGQPLTRMGLRAMLGGDPDLRFLGEAGELETGLAAMERLRPDVVLVDALLAGDNDAAGVRAVLVRTPATRLLAFGLGAGDEEISRLLAAGAAGYLQKTAALREVSLAIRETHAGRRYLSAGVQAQLDHRRRWPPLTGRQRDVLALLAEGRTNAAIAAVFDISPGTVKLHVRAILAKLGVEDRTEAAIVALRRGFVRIG
jgi:DNA-binding NarL/FixJ family response regulator